MRVRKKICRGLWQLAGKQMNILDDKVKQLSKAESGKLCLELADGAIFDDVDFVSLFPLKDPEHFIAVVTGEGTSREEVGILKRLTDLDRGQQELIKEHLALRYFLPEIRDVQKIVRTGGLTEWHVVTDRGSRVFYLAGEKDNVTLTDDGMILITDIDSARYCIPNVHKLRHRARIIVETALP